MLAKAEIRQQVAQHDEETLQRIPKGALFRDCDDRNDKFTLRTGNVYTDQIEALRKAQDACNTLLSEKMAEEKKKVSGKSSDG